MEEILKQIEFIEGMNLDTRTECFMQLQQVKRLKEMLKTELKNCDKPHVSNNGVAVCGYCKGEGWIEEPMRTVPCPRCGGNKQTDC